MIGSVVTIVLTLWNARTKSQIDAREEELKALELQLKERSTGIEESNVLITGKHADATEERAGENRRALAERRDKRPVLSQRDRSGGVGSKAG